MKRENYYNEIVRKDRSGLRVDSAKRPGTESSPPFTVFAEDIDE